MIISHSLRSKAWAWSILLALSGTLHAQNPPAPTPGSDVQKRVEEGRRLLADEDVRALATLREAAQIAFKSLSAATKQEILSAPPASLPDDAVTATLANRAAEASFYWGVAAKKFARRDEAITAFARGARALSALPSPPLDSRLQTELNGELSALTGSGLPRIAPEDVLQTLSLRTRIGDRPPLWTTTKWTFSPSPLAAQVGGKPLPARELLVTQGQLLKGRGSGANDSLVATPSYYARFPASSLPPTLQLNQLVLGYAREASGPNAGQWRLLVRVFYSAAQLNVNRRSDRERAEKLARQFLQVHSLFQDGLGLSNLYTSGEQDQNVTTLWLLEVSSLWPADDDDPLVQAQLGPLMPAINTGPRAQNPTEPVLDPLKTLWQQPISGQNEGAPGEIMFWRAGLERPEASWLSTMFHEYGHVALPAFGGFKPPLEPYGNGILGETLGMLWGAGAPTQFGIPLQERAAQTTFLATDFLSHVNSYALPTHRLFLQNGPDWRLKNSGTPEALRFLAGTGVFLERVYGAQFLGRVLDPLAKRSASAASIAARRSLLVAGDLFDTLPRITKGGWNGANWPIWLAGATDLKMDAQTLVNRGAVELRNAQSTNVTLWIPNGAQSLLVTGQGADKLRSIGFPFKNETGTTRIFFAGRTGWVNFGLSAGGNVKIDNARFEKK